ncbi:MAG: MoaD/ThiS family protein [Ginsengibacter sp.]
MQILAFGIAKDIFGNPTVEVDDNKVKTIHQLKIFLEESYPRLSGLGSYIVALNNEYASGNEAIKNGDELAIIPPVSGG